MAENTAPLHLAKYDLVKFLGSGGVAEVWKAFDIQLERFVVLKLLRLDIRNDPAFQARFLHEAQLIARLHHPNIVQIHDFQIWQPDPGSSRIFSGQPVAYMVMDYIEGPTLADYIQRTSAAGHIPSPVEIAGLFMSICQAVAYAHSQGMIHRDLKPANILLDWRNTHRNPMGEPVLTDFGIACLLGVPSTGQTEVQFGTPAYISPEQIHGEPGTERSDLYSLGIILYEITTGVLPFSGNHPVDIMQQHLHVMPLVPSLINPQLPPALVQVIMRNLAKDPAQRSSSALSLMCALSHALGVPLPAEVAGVTSSQSLPSVSFLTGAATHALNVPLPASEPTRVTPAPSLVRDAASVPAPPSQPSTWDVTPAPTPPGPPSADIQGPTMVLPVTPRRTPVIRTGPSPQGALRSPPAQCARRWLTPLIVVLLIGLIAAGLGAWLVPHVFVSASPLAGRAFYTSSGFFVPETARGVADQVQVDLQNVPAPQSGNSYYLWLLNDTNPFDRKQARAAGPVQPPLLLTNNLSANGGRVHYVFPGTANHDNLLAVSSRLLITEEPAGRTAHAPSGDRQAWRYFASIPQQTIHATKYSALSHIRHLLYNDVRSSATDVVGGVGFWMTKNTEKVLEWAVAARDSWYGADTSDGQIDLMRAHFIRILDFLDGVDNVHVDLPAGTPIMVNEDDARGARALLTVDPLRQSATNLENPFGLLDHTQFHVGQVARATDISPEMRAHTASIIDAVKHARVWLSQVRTLSVTLFQRASSSYDQMREAEAGRLLDDLVTKATYAYIGQLDPVTHQVRTGVTQAYYAMQQLTGLTISSEMPGNL